MLKRSILIIAALMLLLAVTACGTSNVTTGGTEATATPTAEPTPISDVRVMVDYSVDKSLTPEIKTLLLQVWDSYISTNGLSYEIDGDFAYYGVFNGHIFMFVPIVNIGADEINLETGYDGSGYANIFVYGYEKLVTYWYAYSHEWVFDQEILDSIWKQHFCYCEDVLGYSYVLENVLPSDSVKTEIERALALIGTHNQELVWGPANDGLWLSDYDVIYFGEYNGYHMFFAKYIYDGYITTFLSIEKGAEIYKFNTQCDFIAYGFKDGKVYLANELFGSGEIDGQDINEMQRLEYAYNVHCYRMRVMLESGIDGSH